MSQTTIAVIVGSLRRDSFNRKLADALAPLAPPDFTFKHLSIGELPPYNQDDDANPAAAVQRLKAELSSSQGLLFVTPEYNRSIPGVLKNAIDHASRPYGQSAWAGKPAGVIGVSVGAMGTALAQQHLRNILAYLDVPTLGQPEAFVQAKEGCSTRPAASAPTAASSCRAGWTATSPGSASTRPDAGQRSPRRTQRGQKPMSPHTSGVRQIAGFIGVESLR